MPQQVLRAGSVTLDPAAPRVAVVDRGRRLEPKLEYLTLHAEPGFPRCRFLKAQHAPPRREARF
jgi:hypothetical protein